MRTEAHGFFDAGPHRLFAALHPVHASARRDTGVLLVHPFMEERQDSHPVLKNLALDLAAQGFSALRFDLYGHGDSAGEWSEATVDHWLEDIANATALLKRETGASKVALMGLRFGATLAGLSARALAPEHLVLWQPVSKGAAYGTDLLRANIAAEMVLHKRAGVSREVLIERLGKGENINLFGYEFSPAQYNGLQAIDLHESLKGYAGKTLVVDVVRVATARETPDFKALVGAIGERARLEKVVETQSLFTEGKVHYTRAEAATAATLAFLTG